MAKVIKITIPEKLERRLAGMSRSELERNILDFLELRALGIEMAESKDVQKGILELLATKSKLTKGAAVKLAKRIELGMPSELLRARMVHDVKGAAAELKSQMTLEYIKGNITKRELRELLGDHADDIDFIIRKTKMDLVTAHKFAK